MIKVKPIESWGHSERNIKETKIDRIGFSEQNMIPKIRKNRPERL